MNYTELTGTWVGDWGRHKNTYVIIDAHESTFEGYYLDEGVQHFFSGELYGQKDIYLSFQGKSEEYQGVLSDQSKVLF